MNSDMVDAIASLITALATCGGLIIPIFMRKNKDRQEKYYKKVLLPFVVAYHENNQMDVVSYFIKRHTRDKEFIPPYTFFICDNPESDEDTPNETLKKVLLMDYKKYYRNYDNSVMLAMGKINNILEIVACMLVLIFIFLLAYIAASELISMILSISKATKIINIITIIGNHIGPIICLCIMILFSSFAFTYFQKKIDDEYSLRIKKIKKIIASKVSSYNKNHGKYQL